MLINIVGLILAIILIYLIFKKFAKNPKKASILAILSAFLMIVIPLIYTLAVPQMNLSPDLKIEVNSTSKIPIPKTSCFFKDLTSKVEISSNIDFTKLGTYEVTYLVPTIFGTYKQSQKLEVVDTTAPVITLNLEKYSEQSYIKTYEEAGANVFDNYDGDITSKLKITKKEPTPDTIEVIYEATDSSGNKAKEIRTIKLIDDIAPVLTLKGETPTIINLNQEYVEKGAEAIDDKEGNLTSNITIEGEVNTSKVGTYVLKYLVKDSKGNLAQKERRVLVVDPTNPPKEFINSNKTIYLTFDDGPSIYTNKLLDVLKKYQVKATFFVTNQGLTKGHDQDIKRAYEEGHTIGLHTYSHSYKDIYKSEEAYFNDLYAIQNKVKNITGCTSSIIRFPGGSSNTISKFNPQIMTRLAKEVEARGFKYFDWNVDSDDAGRARTSTKVYQNVIKALGKGKTYVVLQHDVKGYSVDAVEKIILYGLNNGYKFQALTLESPTTHHGINN